MLNKIFILLVFCLIMCLTAKSQKQKAKFTSINSFGMLAGANQSVFTMQSFNGFSRNLWVHGLGFAFENYGSNSSPIFLGTRRYLSSAKKAFVYADGGINIPWRTSSFPKQSSNTGNGFDLKIKPYAEFGFGITTPINKESKFIAQLGYSYKAFGFTEKNAWIWVGPTPMQNQDIDYNFEYRRIAFKIGIIF